MKEKKLITDYVEQLTYRITIYNNINKTTNKFHNILFNSNLNKDKSNIDIKVIDELFKCIDNCYRTVDVTEIEDYIDTKYACIAYLIVFEILESINKLKNLYMGSELILGKGISDNINSLIKKCNFHIVSGKDNNYRIDYFLELVKNDDINNLLSIEEMQKIFTHLVDIRNYLIKFANSLEVPDTKDWEREDSKYDWYKEEE